MKKKNDDLKIGAFLAPGEETIGGLKLRPFSAGSFLVCQRRGLGLFTGEQTESTEQMWQMMAFLYLHSAPMDEVLIASGNDEAFRKAVDAFAFTLSPAIFRAAVEKISLLCQQVGAASVTVEPKPSRGGASQESPPPNS